MQTSKPLDPEVKSENGLSYSIRIEATFGSEFQRAVAIKNLNGLLSSWKTLVEAHHKKNAVAITRGRSS